MSAADKEGHQRGMYGGKREPQGQGKGAVPGPDPGSPVACDQGAQGQQQDEGNAHEGGVQDDQLRSGAREGGAAGARGAVTWGQGKVGDIQGDLIILPAYPASQLTPSCTHS